jgi:alkanesulfonate monooxygenase SsuD/methylene tetrahydromethanopterin reductase-like flavin-dependent oxidoreductase (luciferase family)
MKYALEIVPFGLYANPMSVVELAQAAEEAGWDGVFTWDHAGFVGGMPVGEALVTLVAVAASTSRISLGTYISALPRRGPHMLAHAIAALDVLSNGRVICGVGAGGQPHEFTAVGQSGDLATLLEMLDEGLPLFDRLLRGEEVTHHGRHYRFEGLQLLPAPVQQPRPRIWLGGGTKAALRRAARWDGWAASNSSPDGATLKTPEQFAGDVDYLRRHRDSADDFDVVVNGWSEPANIARPREYEAAGATWWLESIHGMRAEHSTLMRRIEAGPPR